MLYCTMLVLASSALASTGICTALHRGWSAPTDPLVMCPMGEESARCDPADLDRLEIEGHEPWATATIDGQAVEVYALGPGGSGRFWDVYVVTETHWLKRVATTLSWRHLYAYGQARDDAGWDKLPLLADVDEDGIPELIAWSDVTAGSKSNGEALPVYRAYAYDADAATWRPDEAGTHALARTFRAIYRHGPDDETKDRVLAPPSDAMDRGFAAVLDGTSCLDGVVERCAKHAAPGTPDEQRVAWTRTDWTALQQACPTCAVTAVVHRDQAACIAGEALGKTVWPIDLTLSAEGWRVDARVRIGLDGSIHRTKPTP